MMVATMLGMTNAKMKIQAQRGNSMYIVTCYLLMIASRM